MTFIEEKLRPDIRELTIERGLDYPSNEELLMLILGSGTRKRKVETLASEAMNKILYSNPENYVSELLKIEGIGKSKALAVAAAMELGKRMTKSPVLTIRQPSDILPFVKQYALNSVENFITVTLSGNNQLISIRVCAVGSENMACIKSRQVFFEAVKENASAMILVHNHPSGTLTPSLPDLSMTKKMVRAGDEIGISVVDHLIITREGYFSFAEHGIINEE